MSFNPDVPLIICTDVSEYAVGAVLEQMGVESVVPTVDLLRDAPPGTNKPVAFYSRKLTSGQARKWTLEEKKTYTIVSALEKYSGVVGVQPLLVLTDHRTLQSLHKRAIDTPAGMSGRRAKWHETLSRFDISVCYIPGTQNELAERMSHLSYHASRAYADISMHCN